MLSSVRTVWFVAVVAALTGCGLFDAQTDPKNGASVGDSCPDGGLGTQSTCDLTETCVPISEGNMCTLNCSSDSDCGENGMIANHCLAYNSNQICFRGCDPTVATSCGRTDFLCVTATNTTEHVCAPDCRQQGSTFCPYSTVCDSTDGGTAGSCQQIPCSTNSGCAAYPGTVCAPVNGRMFCVPDCSALSCVGGSCTSAMSCPTGTMCNQMGGCDTVLQSEWQPCGSAMQCNAHLLCVSTSSSSPGVCMPSCATDNDCAGAGNMTTGAPSCSLTLTIGTACAIPCIAGVSQCPPNTACQQVNLNSQTESLCLPGTATVQDAGM